jgi:hypothetical protein
LESYLSPEDIEDDSMEQTGQQQMKLKQSNMDQDMDVQHISSRAKTPQEISDDENNKEDKPGSAENPIVLDDTPEPEARPAGKVKTIRTHFCHPMRFCHHDRTPDRSEPCHFCRSHPTYPLLGYALRTVQVIAWPGGDRYDEVKDGHRGEGKSPTRMCVECSVARMSIVLCGEKLYNMQPLPADRKSQLTLEEAMDNLMTKESGAKADKTWCSICCNLATHECVKGSLKGVPGCGLVLCESCVELLDDHLGFFDGMVEGIVDTGVLEDEKREDGWRADYGLLKQRGLLMEAMRKIIDPRR